MPIITDQEALERACAAWARAPHLAVDTEFLREKTYYPKLCLIQVAAPAGGRAAAVDPLASGIRDLAPLMALLHDPAITKVFHAAKQDLEIVFHITGRLPAPVFDTQVAAMVCGYGEQVGYEALVAKVTGAAVDKGAQFTDWSRRPLSDKQVAYALGDVTHLLEVYDALLRQLDRRGRAGWITEEDAALADPALYEFRPEEAWRRLKVRNPKAKNLVVLRALAAWREREAQRADRPRGWILRDEALTELATRLPRSMEEISALRGIPPSFRDGSKGKTVLALMEEALATPQKTWPQPERKAPMDAEAAERLELFKMLRKMHAARLGVAPHILSSSDDLRDLAIHGEGADIPLLRGWRLAESGQEMLDLASGRLAIGLQDGKIQAMRVTQRGTASS